MSIYGKIIYVYIDCIHINVNECLTYDMCLPLDHRCCESMQLTPSSVHVWCLHFFSTAAPGALLQGLTATVAFLLGFDGG